METMVTLLEPPKSVSSEPLHHSLLLAQPKAVQGVKRIASVLRAPAIAHMRPSNGLPQPDYKSGDSVVPMQKLKPCAY